MLQLLLTSLMMALPGQAAAQDPSPGALRLVRTASSLVSSSVVPPRQSTVAEAWIATARAAIGAAPPEGPPDSVTATPQLMATWASAAIDAAGAGPEQPQAFAYAQVQAQTITRLLQDVDTTGTEPPDPEALARVLLLQGELALVSGDTTAAAEHAHRSATTLLWRENVTIQGITSLATLLARLKDCEGLRKLAQGVHSSQLPEVAAAAASQPACSETAAELIRDPRLLHGARAALLIDQLNQVHASEAMNLLLQLDPALLDTPALRILAVQTFFTDGRLERGLEILGGREILEKLQGRDRTSTLLAMARGHARNGEFTEALALVPKIGGIDSRFLALVAIQSRMLEEGAIEPPEVLESIDSLKSVRTAALDTLLPTIASRPTPLDRVMDAVIASGRFQLGATLLNPLFSPPNQTGDDWLDRRIALLARSLARNGTSDEDAWATLIQYVPWCSRIDQQVRALCVIAMCWSHAHPEAPLPPGVRTALTNAIESIATSRHQRPPSTR